MTRRILSAESIKCMDWQLVSPSRLGRENRTELVAEGANHVDLEADEVAPKLVPRELAIAIA